jgi:hypothetical protein
MHKNITRLARGAKCSGFTTPPKPIFSGAAHSRGWSNPLSAIDPRPSDARPRNVRRAIKLSSVGFNGSIMLVLRISFV